MPTHVCLERVQRFGFQNAIHLLEKIGVRHVQLGELRRTHCRQVAIQIEIGSEGDGVVAAHLVVLVLRVAAGGAVHGRLGQSGFDTQHGLRGIGCLLRRLANQRKRLRDIFHQVLPHRFHFRVVILEVVVAVRQRQAALIDIGDNLVGVVQIGPCVETEERGAADQPQVGDFIDQRALVLHCRNAVEFGLEHGDAFRIHGLLVHARTIEIADSLVDSITARASGGSLLQNVVLDIEIALVKFHKADPPRFVGRNLGVLDPVAACVLVEIHAGINALVDSVQTETRGGFSRGGVRGGRCLGEADGNHEKQQDRQETEPSHRRLSFFEERFRF